MLITVIPHISRKGGYAALHHSFIHDRLLDLNRGMEVCCRKSKVLVSLYLLLQEPRIWYNNIIVDEWNTSMFVGIQTYLCTSMPLPPTNVLIIELQATQIPKLGIVDCRNSNTLLKSVSSIWDRSKRHVNMFVSTTHLVCSTLVYYECHHQAACPAVWRFLGLSFSVLSLVQAWVYKTHSMKIRTWDWLKWCSLSNMDEFWHDDACQTQHHDWSNIQMLNIWHVSRWPHYFDLNQEPCSWFASYVGVQT